MTRMKILTLYIAIRLAVNSVSISEAMFNKTRQVRQSTGTLMLGYFWLLTGRLGVNACLNLYHKTV